MANIRADKPVSVTRGDGRTLIRTEGNLRVKLDHIRKISIDNITRIKRYDLSNGDDFIIHTIQFVNGGSAVLGYSKAGKIMRFQAKGIRMRFLQGDHVVLDPVEGSAN